MTSVKESSMQMDMEVTGEAYPLLSFAQKCCTE
jgi:hypothetical protein